MKKITKITCLLFSLILLGLVVEVKKYQEPYKYDLDKCSYYVYPEQFKDYNESTYGIAFDYHLKHDNGRP